MTAFKLQGVVPPVVTPLEADETLDEAGLERVLERLIAEGVHGLYFLGSTGEQPALRDSQRLRALQAARRIVAGRIPVVVGTMASSTARAIDNIRMAEENGADAVAVTPPHYFPSRGEEEQVAHFQACIEAARGPVVIYNIPLTTKVMLSAETIARIAEHPKVIGVKDSSGDFAHFLRLISLLRGKEHFGLMIGTPPLAGAALLYGADGVVPGVANIDPRTMLNVYASAAAQNITALQNLQQRVHLLMKLITFGAPVACFKTALEQMGICKRYTTAPIRPLSQERRESVAAVLRELELL